jgi:tetratricopeptide (TPR) repeat protein
VLLGEPTDGKTRTIYEVTSKLQGYEVAVLRRANLDNIQKLLPRIRSRHVVLLVDEIERYAGTESDLTELMRMIARASRGTVVVAATCRSGDELEAVRTTMKSNLRRFYDGITYKLSLEAVTDDQKNELAESIGKHDWDPAKANEYPTLGWVTMREALAYMAARFWTLSGEQQATLRALRLLSEAGIRPFTHARVHSIVERVFNRTVTNFNDVLQVLHQRDFIRSAEWQNPIDPQPAYVAHAVTYVAERTPEDDFPALRDALTSLQDPALLYLGLAYARRREHEEAFVCFENLLKFTPESAEAWFGKGTALVALDRTGEALQAYEEALKLPSGYVGALQGKGIAVEQLNRWPESLVVFDRAVQLDPDDPDLWSHKAAALIQLDRFESALDDYDRALAIEPDHRSAWSGRARALSLLGRLTEASEAWEQVQRLWPKDASTWYLSAVVLLHLNRLESALGCLDRTLEIEHNDADVVTCQVIQPLMFK